MKHPRLLAFESLENRALFAANFYSEIDVSQPSRSQEDGCVPAQFAEGVVSKANRLDGFSLPVARGHVHHSELAKPTSLAEGESSPSSIPLRSPSISPLSRSLIIVVVREPIRISSISFSLERDEPVLAPFAIRSPTLISTRLGRSSINDNPMSEAIASPTTTNVATPLVMAIESKQSSVAPASAVIEVDPTAKQTSNNLVDQSELANDRRLNADAPPRSILVPVPKGMIALDGGKTTLNTRSELSIASAVSPANHRHGYAIEREPFASSATNLQPIALADSRALPIPPGMIYLDLDQPLRTNASEVDTLYHRVAMNPLTLFQAFLRSQPVDFEPIDVDVAMSSDEPITEQAAASPFSDTLLGLIAMTSAIYFAAKPYYRRRSLSNRVAQDST
jgi:hypothetical protein